jgi:glycosyltransferase involved in cell wall biosynthesis
MKLSIIISNRNDIVMLNVTLNSAIEAMKGCKWTSEIVVCDNSDPKFVELLPLACPVGFTRKHNVRIIRQKQPCFTSARMRAAEAAKGEYLFCVDSHVLFGRETLNDSIDFMERHSSNPMLGFGHPPIRWAHQGPAAIKHTLKVSDKGLPNGGWDGAFATEQQMYWKFMPWICRRDWYLNTLKGYGAHSDHMISWGGAEQLQQVKSLMLGYENWAIITDPIAHIGPYTPAVVKTGQYKYRTYTANGNFPHGFGVLLAYAVTGGPIEGYKHAKIGEEAFTNRHKIKVDDYWEKAVELAANEYNWLQENKKYDYLELLETKPWNEQRRAA